MANNRGRYTTVSLQDRERLTNAFTTGQNWVLLAAQLGIKRQTARSVIVSFERNDGRVAPLPKGGLRPKRLTNEMVETMISYLGSNAAATLDQVKEHLLTHFPDLIVSIHTISRALDCAFITLKKLYSVPDTWNTDVAKEGRLQHVQWLLNLGIIRVIYLDEFGVNLYTCRTRGQCIFCMFKHKSIF